MEALVIKADRIASLDFFRVVGPLLIFLCHITVFDTHIGGGVPVEMFFVLSGFGMCLGYSGKNELGFMPYMRRRFSKLYPTYFITILMGGVYMVCLLHHDVLRMIMKIPVYMVECQTIAPPYS